MPAGTTASCDQDTTNEETARSVSRSAGCVVLQAAPVSRSRGRSSDSTNARRGRPSGSENDEKGARAHRRRRGPMLCKTEGLFSVWVSVAKELCDAACWMTYRIRRNLTAETRSTSARKTQNQRRPRRRRPWRRPPQL